MTIVIITVVVLVVILILSQIKSKPKNIWDSPAMQKQREAMAMIEKMCEGGTDQDVMPDGYGEFGHASTNPIPTKTPMGSISYLGKLRTMDGVKVKYHRVGSMSSPNIDSMIDQYEITANERKIATLFICPYNKKNSDRPPKGFNLAPLPWA